MELARCHVTGKDCWPDYLAAKACAKRARSKTGTVVSARMCVFCGCFHIRRNKRSVTARPRARGAE